VSDLKLLSNSLLGLFDPAEIILLTPIIVFQVKRLLIDSFPKKKLANRGSGHKTIDPSLEDRVEPVIKRHNVNFSDDDYHGWTREPHSANAINIDLAGGGIIAKEIVVHLKQHNMIRTP
jgi:hypothetical protein